MKKITTAFLTVFMIAFLSTSVFAYNSGEINTEFVDPALPLDPNQPLEPWNPDIPIIINCPIVPRPLIESIPNGTRTTQKPWTGHCPIECLCPNQYGYTYCSCDTDYEVVNQGMPGCSCKKTILCDTGTSYGPHCTPCPTGTSVPWGMEKTGTITDCKCTNSGYYYNGYSCTRCPQGAVRISGLPAYGTSFIRIHQRTECYLPTDTYKGNNGLYKTTKNCYI